MIEKFKNLMEEYKKKYYPFMVSIVRKLKKRISYLETTPLTELYEKLNDGDYKSYTYSQRRFEDFFGRIEEMKNLLEDEDLYSDDLEKIFRQTNKHWDQFVEYCENYDSYISNVEDFSNSMKDSGMIDFWEQRLEPREIN